MAFKNYLDLVYRRRWLILIPSVLGLVGGIVALTQIPKVYEASIRILVSSNQLSEKLMLSALPARVDPALLIARVQSRPNLEIVAREFGMLRADATPAQVESACARLKTQVVIEYDTRMRSWYEVYAEDEGAVRAADLANRFAKLIVDEQVREREERIQRGLELFIEERDAVEQAYRAKDAELAEYMRTHPDVVSNNYAQLQESARESVRQAEAEITRREDQIATLSISAASGGAAVPSDVKVPLANSPATELTQLREELARLLERLTEKHPDVKAKQVQIASLLAEHPELAEAPASETGSEAGLGAARTPLDLQIRRLQTEIETWEGRKRAAQQDMDRYTQLVHTAPRGQQVLTQLQLDVNELRSQWLNAKQKASQMEQQQRADDAKIGEQYQVQEPAKVPKRPARPIAAQVILVGFMAGLGLGVGLALLLEYLNHSFRSEEDFQRAYPDVVLLAAIPNLQQAARAESKAALSGRRTGKAAAR